MTAINRILREIKKEKATEVYIRSNEVRTIAEHARLTQYHDKFSIDDIEKIIRKGDLKILSVPVKVLGNETD